LSYQDSLQRMLDQCPILRLALSESRLGVLAFRDVSEDSLHPKNLSVLEYRGPVNLNMHKGPVFPLHFQL